jgi:hypothetical protein
MRKEFSAIRDASPREQRAMQAAMAGTTLMLSGVMMDAGRFKRLRFSINAEQDGGVIVGKTGRRLQTVDDERRVDEIDQVQTEAPV